MELVREWTSIGNACGLVVDRIIAAERRFVAAGWFDPIGLHDAAFEHGLRDDDFGDPRLGFVYSYLAAVAERGKTPDVSECLAVAEDHGDIPLDALDRDWLERLILGEDVDLGWIEAYAAEVKHLADARGEFHRLLTTVLPDDDVEVRIRPRQRERMILQGTLVA